MPAGLFGYGDPLDTGGPLDAGDPLDTADLAGRATEGELWSHEQLRALRARRFSPPAIAALLLASQRRADQVRAACPELARQVRLWSVAGGCVWVVLVARGPRAQKRLRAGLAWWTACALMLDWHLGMLETLDGRPRMLGPADALTLARAWLVPLAWERPTVTACALAGLTDALDGPLARRRGSTRAGAAFDWIVDACFAAAALRGASRHRLLDPWAVRAEAAWLGLGAVRALYAYFVAAGEPDRTLTRAARPFAPARMAGLVWGAAGRRRAGSALLGAGALASVAVSGYQLARRSRGARRRRARRGERERAGRASSSSCCPLPVRWSA